jgi:hypothetical protein
MNASDPKVGVGFIDKSAFGFFRNGDGVIVIRQPDGSALVMLVQPSPFVILREVLSPTVPRKVAEALHIARTGPTIPKQEQHA